MLGGSSYTLRDYICVTLLVSGTTLVSTGTNHRKPAPEGRQWHRNLDRPVTHWTVVDRGRFHRRVAKKLKPVTANLAHTAFDFLY
jgi:hypothetical protein